MMPKTKHPVELVKRRQKLVSSNKHLHVIQTTQQKCLLKLTKHHEVNTEIPQITNS